MKVHARKAQTMFDVARTQFYLALSSSDSVRAGAVAECLTTVQAIFDTYRSPTPIQDYQTYRSQSNHLAHVHQSLFDATLLKLRCLVTVTEDLAQA